MGSLVVWLRDDWHTSLGPAMIASASTSRRGSRAASARALGIVGAICAIIVIILVSDTVLGDPFWWMPW